jgi:hypothetical protein
MDVPLPANITHTEQEGRFLQNSHDMAQYLDKNHLTLCAKSKLSWGNLLPRTRRGGDVFHLDTEFAADIVCGIAFRQVGALYYKAYVPRNDTKPEDMTSLEIC